MKHQPRSLALLRNANPVRVDPALARSSQAAAAFERIIAEPRGPQVGQPRRRGIGSRAGSRTRRRVRLGVGGAGIVAALAAIVVLAISGSTVEPAFAGWSARPTVARTGQSAEAIRRCGLTSPVLVEARGPYTAAVFASRAGGSACIEGPSMSFVGSIGGVRAPDNPIRANQVQTAVASSSDSKGHAFVLLAGRVGSAVRSIVIHRRNHSNVIASIDGGWYLAWWPAGAPATNATVTTSSGVQDIALPSLATSRQSACGGRPNAACARAQVGSDGPGSAGVPGPPLIGGPLAKPFDDTLLLEVDNASRVLVCLHPPHSTTAALRPGGPTGPCTDAALLTRLPTNYPVQRNLLEVFPNSVWEVKLPTGTPDHGALTFLVIAVGQTGWGQTRNEITESW
jgi:hypothetical protein